MEPLHDTLCRAGQQPMRLAFADGSQLFALPFGGRVLALYPPGSDENFLWTNPALATGESAAAYFHRSGWLNPGGDRTWLAPEIELFIGDLARPAETYAVPAALDPGNWTLAAATDTELNLTQTTRLRLHRAKQDVGVRLEKVLSPAANPLPGAGLEYAGYSQVTTLETEAPPDGAVRLGIWNLLQLPPPGTMLVPTRAATPPQTVFGVLSRGELAVATRGVRWEMAGPGADAKIALRAGALTGRVGYLCATPCRAEATPGRPDALDLVVREFTVEPDGDYVDALWEPPHATGWAFQACCVRNGAERFNELEYHAPAASPAAGRSRRCDQSRVWAFRGPADTIGKAAAALLGPCDA